MEQYWYQTLAFCERYARVSTQEQNLDLQLRALKNAGCRKIFREKVSGSSRRRPEFHRMLDQIRSGEAIVVWKLDRLAQSTRDLLDTMEAINQAGATSLFKVPCRLTGLVERSALQQ